MQGLLAAYARAASFALQYGMPLPKFVESFKSMKFSPQGITLNMNRTLQFCDSIIDYLAKLLEDKYLTNIPSRVESEKEAVMVTVENGSTTGSFCRNCGSIMLIDGTCHTCPNCANNDGCGGG